MPVQKAVDLQPLARSEKKIEALEQQARDLAHSVEAVRLQTLAQSNERIEALETAARDLAGFVETTRQRTLLQSDKKIEALEQKARDLAQFVENLRTQTLLQSDTEIETLGQHARDLAVSVETVRKETRLQSEAEIALLGQQARDLALSVEIVRKETRLQSETEIALLGQRARDLALSVESVREETLLRSDNEIAALGVQASDLASVVETVRQQTLIQSNERIEALEKRARAYDSNIFGNPEQALDMIGNILESSTEYSIIGKTLDGTIILWNEGATRLYGYQPDEVVGVANSSILHTPEDVAAGKDREMLDGALHNGNWEGAVMRLRKNGERFAARVVITPRRNAHGRTIGFLLISKDISAEIDSARQRSELKFRLAVDSAANAMVMVNKDGKIVVVNAQTEKLFGYARDELIGQQVELLVPVSLRERHPGHRDGFFANPTARAMGVGRDLHGRRKDGSEFPVEIGLNPIETDDGVFVMSAIVDITERKRLENVLHNAHLELESRVRARTGELETANKELEAFSYSISHDLRAPLRAIDGFSRILLEDYAGPLPVQAKDYLKLVCDNSHRMSQLLDDMLAFSRLSRQALTKQTINPGEMVRQCLAEMQPAQEGRQMQIVIADLPSCNADPSLLKQVWTNLLSNALKYTLKREAVRISIGCRKEPRRLTDGQASQGPKQSAETVYFVEDNGAGFDMKYADKLFGVFQRLHRASDFEGTGVGLAIVQRIVNRHGGRVWGEAQLNKGAIFSFTLE